MPIVFPLPCPVAHTIAMATPTPGKAPTKLPPLKAATPDNRTVTTYALTEITDRIYKQPMERKRENLKKLESKFYKVADPEVITKEQAKASAERQVNEEMKRRKQRQEELERKYNKPTEYKKLRPEELQEGLQRMYTQALERKKKNLEKLEAAHDVVAAARKEKHKTISKDEVVAMGERLCKPVKRDYTHDEINKILGLK